MTLDLYSSARVAKRTQEVGYEAFVQQCENRVVQELIFRFRGGDADAKKMLPAVTYMGKSTTGRRRAADMKPTGLVMLDIDHADAKLPALIARCKQSDFMDAVRPALIHITPSGQGLRIVYPMPPAVTDVADAQRLVAERYNLSDYGIFDEACKDLSRLSFLPQKSDIVYINGDILFADYDTDEESMLDHGAAAGASEDGDRPNAGLHRGGSDLRALPTEADGEVQGPNAGFSYNDVPVSRIAREYIEWKGEPQEGETHNFYNAMVADFRHICNNSPAILVDVLPLLGQTREERMRQCRSICQKNYAVKIPLSFWRWLKNKGYWVENTLCDNEEDVEDPYAAEHDLLSRMPTLPPVFREYVNSAPTEFKIPVILALLPIMGTLATYLEAEFYDGEVHTPSFFTIIYAPAGQGKSFINKLINLDIDRSASNNLLHELLRRDVVTEARTNLWLKFSNTKKDNEKGKVRPKTTTRILPAIFSQADFLPVMKDNQGMHMFCFAPEIDTLIKGMKAGGGDKNDIFRIAWDNGTYGQSYRGINSFRGKVALYLNVLTTGTPAQCAKLFRDVENGLVTRCSFTDLGAQAYAKYQPWKKLSKKDLQIIENFRQRCEANTYDRSLSFDITTLDEYEDDEEKFDEAVPWEYHFRGRTKMDLSEVNKALLKWVEQQRVIAEQNADLAHDAFRKRSAVRAFRVALLCHACWNKVGAKERKVIKDFALWFADLDLMKCLKRWGKEYNAKQAESVEQVGKVTRDTVFSQLSKDFTTGDVTVALKKNGFCSVPRNVISAWRKAGLIERVTKNQYRKK